MKQVPTVHKVADAYTHTVCGAGLDTLASHAYFYTDDYWRVGTDRCATCVSLHNLQLLAELNI